MPSLTLQNFPHTLLLVGAGRMGGSMLEGWLALGLPPEKVIVSDPHPSQALENLMVRYPAIRHVSEPVRGADIVVLAIKPQLFAELEALLAKALDKDTLLLSVLAGKTLAGLGRSLHAEQPVIRAMPNTPASVGRGITALVGNAHVSSIQKQAADELLKAVGEVVWLSQEEQMDAVTAISGSGPAYIFLLTEALAEAGEALGLPPELAMQLARYTVSGSGELQHQSADAPSVLRQNVTSPNGTTAAALDVLMAEDGLKALMQRATAAAAKRSQELAG